MHSFELLQSCFAFEIGPRDAEAQLLADFIIAGLSAKGRVEYTIGLWDVERSHSIVESLRDCRVCRVIDCPALNAVIQVCSVSDWAGDEVYTEEAF